MKILYITTIGSTMTFFESFIELLLNEGNTVEIATNDTSSKVPQYYHDRGCIVHPISTERSPLKKGNWLAIKQIKALVQKNNYDIVHCHTPIAAMCTRIACRKLRKKGLKVIYTAHGFHFYKGAPIRNWIIYYPIEKLCSRWTDVLIAINKEDYELAQKRFFCKQVEYVPGVGLSLDRFRDVNVEVHSKRHEIGVPLDVCLVLSVGEVNKNKNHQVVIKAIASLNDKKIHYAIVGKGPLTKKLQELSRELEIENQIHFLGYRKDIPQLLKSADVFCFPSIREGLGLAAIEAMASGLPLVVADNRGTREYVQDGFNGFVCEPSDYTTFGLRLKELQNNKVLRNLMGERGGSVSEKYDVKAVNLNMSDIYSSLKYQRESDEV